MNELLQWEQIGETPPIYRIKIDGGYIYMTTAWDTVSTVFVPMSEECLLLNKG